MIHDLSDLNNSQKRGLRLILEGQVQGKPPTYREMASRLGWRSTNAVSDMIDGLVAKGYVERTGGNRSVVLTAAYREALAGFMVLSWLGEGTVGDVADYLVSRDPAMAHRLRAALEEAQG